MGAFDALLRETMVLAAILCIPVLAIAALVGTAVAIVQAATQVQEQTLTLLPKVIAVGLTLAVFGAFAMHACSALFDDALAAIPALVYGS
jgi:flagellar biosynthesis protein FliQ